MPISPYYYTPFCCTPTSAVVLLLVNELNRQFSQDENCTELDPTLTSYKCDVIFSNDFQTP